METAPHMPDAHGTPIKKLQSLQALASVENMKHRPLNFGSVREEDKPVVAAILESMYLMGAQNQTRSSLMQTNLEVHPNAYYLTVKLVGSAIVDSSASMAVWDSAPTRIETVHVVPVLDADTDIRYLAFNVKIRSVRASPPVLFVLHQELHQALRINRSAFYDAYHHSPVNNTILESGYYDSDEEMPPINSSLRQPTRAARREPWAFLDHAADRDSVKQLIEACFDMAMNPTNARFWQRVEVQGPSPGRADRITVTWKLPEGEPLDVAAFYTLHLQQPTAIDRITCQCSTSGRAIAIKIVLFSVVAKESTVISTRVLNIYATHRGASASLTNDNGVHGPGLSYKPSTGKTPLNPATIAERVRHAKRPREVDLVTAGPTPSPSAPNDLPVTEERDKKRRRLEREREEARNNEATSSVPILRRVYTIVESFL